MLVFRKILRTYWMAPKSNSAFLPLKQFISRKMNQEMSREVGRLNSLVSHFFIEKMFVFFSFCLCNFFKKNSRKMIFVCGTNYLNKENSDYNDYHN